MPPANPHRLVEVDALRGVAALAVVLFHLTARFQELYPTNGSPTLVFSSGHYGVNLFFVISGFVIFMTLDKTAKSMDFVVSRFSRLFPAYWVAIFLTFTICNWLGLPGKTSGFATAVANMLMVHGLFRVPHVDGVYWTLEVELLFYCGMFILYRANQLKLVHLAISVLLVLRIVYFIAEHQWGISLPWMVFRLLILQYIPWFALGISIYLMRRRQSAQELNRARVTIVGSVVVLCICDSIWVGLLSVALAALVYMAAGEHLRPLRYRPLVWLGMVSYPLYLLHENIGWAIQLRLAAVGASPDQTVVGALAASLLLAGLLTRGVEQPAMRWIRVSYRRRNQPASD